MKNFLTFTLIINFLIPHSEVLAKICVDAKNDLIELQKEENALKYANPTDASQINLKKLKDKRNEMLAKLMLLDGIEANIEQFNTSLEKVSKGSVSLKDLLDDDAESLLMKSAEGENLSKLDKTFESHIEAMEDIEVAYDLVNKFNPSKFNKFIQYAWDDFMPEGMKFSQLNEITDPEKLSQIEQKWNSVDGEHLANFLNNLCRNTDFGPQEDIKEQGRDFCKKMNKIYSDQGPKEDKERQQKQQQMVAGYLGLMKHIVKKPDEVGNKDDDFHAALKKRIESQLPKTGEEKENFLNNKNYQEEMKQLQSEISKINKSNENVPLLKKAIKQKAKCRLEGKKANECKLSNIMQPKEIQKINSLKGSYEALNKYLKGYTNADRRLKIETIKNDRLLEIEGKLDSIEKLLGISDEKSKTRKLLDGTLIGAQTFESQKAFEDYFANGERKQCFETLMKQLGETDGIASLGKNENLKNMLHELAGDACKISAEVDKSKFNTEMVSCLMELRERVGLAKIEDLKKKYNEEVSSMDLKIKSITDRDDFKSITASKSKAIEDLAKNCSDLKIEDHTSTLNCKIGNYGPLNEKLLKIADDFITIADVNTEQLTVTSSNNTDKLDRLSSVTSQVPSPLTKKEDPDNSPSIKTDNNKIKGAGEDAREGTEITNEPMVASEQTSTTSKNSKKATRKNSEMASTFSSPQGGSSSLSRQQSRIRANNHAKLKIYEARNKKYAIVGRDPDGRAIYKRRDRWFEMLGRSVAHVAPSWTKFYVTKMGADAYLKAEKNRATYLTQWYQSYHRHPYSSQLQSLNQRMTFNFSQQPIRFA